MCVPEARDELSSMDGVTSAISSRIRILTSFQSHNRGIICCGLFSLCKGTRIRAKKGVKNFHLSLQHFRVHKLNAVVAS